LIVVTERRDKALRASSSSIAHASASGARAGEKSLPLNAGTTRVPARHPRCASLAIACNASQSPGQGPGRGAAGAAVLNAELMLAEKDLISDALKTTRGNRAKAARLLNTTERIINYQVRKYAIDYRRFKN